MFWAKDYVRYDPRESMKLCRRQASRFKTWRSVSLPWEPDKMKIPQLQRLMIWTWLIWGAWGLFAKGDPECVLVLEKTLESPLDCKEIQPVHPKGNQSWIFIGRTDAEALILWPPDAKSKLTGKDPDAGKHWGQEEKGDRRWDGWMAPPTQWPWVWANSGRWWGTGKPGMWQSIGAQNVRHNLVTEQPQNLYFQRFCFRGPKRGRAGLPLTCRETAQVPFTLHKGSQWEDPVLAPPHPNSLCDFGQVRCPLWPFTIDSIPQVSLGKNTGGFDGEMSSSHVQFCRVPRTLLMPSWGRGKNEKLKVWHKNTPHNRPADWGLF